MSKFKMYQLLKTVSKNDLVEVIEVSGETYLCQYVNKNGYCVGVESDFISVDIGIEY